jgi:hypothetical protein
VFDGIDMPKKKSKLVLLADRIATARGIIDKQQALLETLRIRGQPTHEAEGALRTYVSSLMHLLVHESKLKEEAEAKSPLHADQRNFHKVEKWTRDGTKIDSLLYAGNSLDKARHIFERAIKHRPRIRLTIRQRTRVLQEWPQK